MNNPLVSVILAVYNGGEFLVEAIESILNQSYKNFELIIIDDASTDNSFSIIKSYKKKDSRIKILRNKENKYAAFSRNLGFSKAEGKYIAIMDADDISLPTRLEKQVNYLENHKDVFLVGSSAIHINENGKEIGKFDSIKVDNININIVIVNPFYNSSIMFRNEKIFSYREKIFYAEDYDAFLLMHSKSKKLDNLTDYLIKYRILSTSVSRSKRVKQALFMQKAQEFYRQKLSKGSDDYDEFNPKEFLEIDDMEKKSDSKLLIFAIKNSVRYYDDLIFYSKKLIKWHGYWHLVLIFYLITFIGKNNFNILIKFIQKIKSVFGLYHS